MDLSLRPHRDVRAAHAAGALLFALGLAACGGGAVGSASAQGTVGGSAYDAVSFSEATAVVVHSAACVSNSGTQDISAVEILLSSRPGLCASESSGVQPASNTLLVLDIEESASATSAAIPIGTYAVGSGASSGTDVNGNAYSASATAEILDATCASSSGGNSRGGTITLTSIANGEVAGSFQIDFDDGALTGTFSTAACPLTDLEFCVARSASLSCAAP